MAPSMRAAVEALVLVPPLLLLLLLLTNPCSGQQHYQPNQPQWSNAAVVSTGGGGGGNGGGDASLGFESQPLWCYQCINCSDAQLQHHRPRICRQYSWAYRISMCAYKPERAAVMHAIERGVDACFKQVDDQGRVNRGCSSADICGKSAGGLNLCYDYNKQRSSAYRRRPLNGQLASMCCCTGVACNAAPPLHHPHSITAQYFLVVAVLLPLVLTWCTTPPAS